MRINVYISAFMLLAVASAQAASDSMRCGSRIISKGDTKVEILLKCGEPILKETIAIKERSRELQLKSVTDSREDKNNQNNHRSHQSTQNTNNESHRDQFGQINLEARVSLPIDRWTYDLGKGRFLRILIFEGGTLVNIVAGDRS